MQVWQKFDATGSDRSRSQQLKLQRHIAEASDILLLLFSMSLIFSHQSKVYQYTP